MPRYVILEHQMPSEGARPTHWDFMLQHAESLWVWTLPAPPDPHQTLLANRLPDHRPLYLDYEGPISSDRGEVRQWDQGTFDWRRRDEDRVEVRLEGERLKGAARLSRDAAERDLWTFRYNED